MAIRAQPKQRPRAAGRPQLQVVRGKGKRSRWSPIPIIVCVVLTVFGVTALQATLGQDGLKAAKLEREYQEESERTTLLRARVAQLSNPGRVADEAAKLGLVDNPGVGQLRVVTDHPETFKDVPRPGPDAP
jgi:cell division protein FtsL